VVLGLAWTKQRLANGSRVRSYYSRQLIVGAACGIDCSFCMRKAVTFDIYEAGISWRLDRNARLVCFFPSRKTAEFAAKSYVTNIRRRRGAADIKVHRGLLRSR
jgi:hypothetical protein